MNAIKISALTILLVATVLTFQNCSPGFFADQGASTASSLASSPDTEELMRAQGKVLYEKQCASCHGEISTSAKFNTSVAAIKNGLTSVSQMQAIALTDDEISAIQVALSPQASSDLRFICKDSQKRGISNPAIRRMSALEVTNTLKGVLGTGLANQKDIAELIAALPADQVVSSVDEFSQVPQALMQVALAAIAKQVVELSDTDLTLRSQLLGTCSTATSVSDACFESFMKTFGLKTRRHPLSGPEVVQLTKTFTDSGKGLKGLQSVLFVMLQAPELVMHVETGTGETEGGRVRLTAYEVASRLSYLILAAPPDAALMQAAEQNQLQTISAIKAHVERLLAASSIDAKSRVSNFLNYYGGLSALEQPRPSVGVANGINTSGLQDQMLNELSEYSNHIFWRKAGNFEDLMTSRDSFPRSDAMMKILGASAKVAANGNPVQASVAHMGYLHRPAFLASPSERTSPILRGVHIRREILCNEIPLPPTEDVDERIEELGDIENQTNRARIGQLTESAACIGCHAQINPLGYLFEGYDQLGLPRSEEKIFDDQGVVSKTWALNTQITNPKLDPDEEGGAVLNDSIALTNAIAKGKTARACFAQKAFEFMRTRRLEAESDGCALREIEKKVQTGSMRDVLIEAVANEDIFWRSNH